MSENELPFLKELRAELRRAAHEQTAGTAELRRPSRRWRLAGIPVLIAMGVIAYFVLAGGPAGVPKVPVADFSGSATAATPPTAQSPAIGMKLVGSKACTDFVGTGHVPALKRSAAAPDKGLLDELSMLRGTTTPFDRTSPNRLDWYPPVIETVFDRYVRIVNGPDHVRLAFVPAAYCNQTGPSTFKPGSIVRETLEQGLLMFPLSNTGKPSPVVVGTAAQIKRGPGMAGTGVDIKGDSSLASLEAVVVPDGVSKVVMKFTPPFLHHHTNTVQIQSNVGIVVRRPAYTPTTVLWYGANGRLIKKFVDRKQIAYDNCLAAHKKGCVAPQ